MYSTYPMMDPYAQPYVPMQHYPSQPHYPSQHHHVPQASPYAMHHHMMMMQQQQQQHHPFNTPVPRMRTPGHTPNRTLPTAWTPAMNLTAASSQVRIGQQQQGTTTAKDSTHQQASTMVPDKTGKSLERGLNAATRDELEQMLLDLSSCNKDAASFINSKVQLIALRSKSPDQQQQQAESMTMMMNATYASSYDAAMTPSKPLAFDDCNTSATVALSSSRQQQQQTQSPMQQLQSNLQDRHTTPETRSFTQESHPCLRLYGNCRHTTSCLFKTLPQNLCLHWLRGSCSSGADCSCVHRLPLDCPSEIQIVFQLSHGGDRADVANRLVQAAIDKEKLAATMAQHPEHHTPRGQRTYKDGSRRGTPQPDGVEGSATALFAEANKENAQQLLRQGSEDAEDCNHLVARCLDDSIERAFSTSQR